MRIGAPDPWDQTLSILPKVFQVPHDGNMPDTGMFPLLFRDFPEEAGKDPVYLAVIRKVKERHSRHVPFAEEVPKYSSVQQEVNARRP